jgi:hypothetical protein
MTDREEVMPEGKKTKKNRECIRCEDFFECVGVPMDLTEGRCIHFKERRHDRKRNDREA